jgi:hypothetical protein
MSHKNRERSIKDENPREKIARIFMERRLKESDRKAKDFASTLDPRQFVNISLPAIKNQEE